MGPINGSACCVTHCLLSCLYPPRLLALIFMARCPLGIFPENCFAKMNSTTSSDEASDEQREMSGSYCFSADVSETESCSSFWCHQVDAEGASCSVPSSPHLTEADDSYSVPITGGKDRRALAWSVNSDKRSIDLSDVEMMKERFSKLLLGEDMSGGGKGVCAALAISNAITNLSATVFGQIWQQLEPLESPKKMKWQTEMEWLLCVSDFIVEFVPSVQQYAGGGTHEVMSTRQRSDLHVNLPALKKLDAMLITMLDGFSDTGFWYVDRGVTVPEGGDHGHYSSNDTRPSIRQEEKWWLPCPKVPPSGMSDEERKSLQQCRDCTNQIMKAAMAINSTVLAEMEVPIAYSETLPKSGKACLGDSIYRYITAEQFSPDCFLDGLRLTTEHRALEMANKLEAAMHVWNRKDQRKLKHHVKVRHPSWGGKVAGGLVSDADKYSLLADRAETLLLRIKLLFPGLSQTALDMAKIQYNKDVGQSILESYSRVLECLAFNIMARIDDVLYVDEATRRRSTSETVLISRRLGGFPIQKRISSTPFCSYSSSFPSPFASPTYCTASPVGSSPRMAVPLGKKGGDGMDESEAKFEKQLLADVERVWSCSAASLSARRLPPDAHDLDRA